MRYPLKIASSQQRKQYLKNLKLDKTQSRVGLQILRTQERDSCRSEITPKDTEWKARTQ